MGKGGPRKSDAPVMPPVSGKQPLRDEEIKRRISESTSELDYVLIEFKGRCL